MAGAIVTRDAEYVAIAKANLIAEAERFLGQRYAAAATYGVIAMFLLLGAVYAAYKIGNSVFRYQMDVKMARLNATDGDNVDDPGDDDEAYVPVWGNGDPPERVPSGNQIRNRIAMYSKRAGRDLRADFQEENDDYEGAAKRRGAWFGGGGEDEDGDAD